MSMTNLPLDQFVFLVIDFSSYSGCAVMNESVAEKLSLDSEVISSGEIKTVHKSTLKCFGKYRAQARTTALKYGTSFMGGYAIPVDKWDETKEKLDVIVDSFKDDSTIFINNYENSVDDWANSWPQSSEVIRAHAHTKDWISTRFNAEVTACYLQPAPGLEAELGEKVSGMFGSICKELAVDARQAVKAYLGGSNFTVKIKNTFENMTNKLNSLSFIDPEITNISLAITEYISKINLPKTGKFEAQEQSKIALILSLMTDENNIRQLATLLKVEQEKVNKLVEAASTDTEEYNQKDDETFVSDILVF